MATTLTFSTPGFLAESHKFIAVLLRSGLNLLCKLLHEPSCSKLLNIFFKVSHLLTCPTHVPPLRALEQGPLTLTAPVELLTGCSQDWSCTVQLPGVKVLLCECDQRARSQENLPYIKNCGGENTYSWMYRDSDVDDSELTRNCPIIDNRNFKQHKIE